MVPGSRDKRIGKSDRGEQRRARWPQLKSVASKCGGKSPTSLMRRSLPRCASAWKHTSKNARTAEQCWTGLETLWVWLVTENCFKCPRGSISVCIKRFRVFRNFMLRAAKSALAGMGRRHLGYPCTSTTSTYLLYFSARCPHSDPYDGSVDRRP